MEQTRISNHAIVQQFLVARRRLAVSELVVIKVQTNRTRTDCRARNLCADLESNSFVRLDVEDQIIWCNWICLICCKQRQWRCLEPKDDLRRTSRHSFPRSQVKGHPSPAPILNP